LGRAEWKQTPAFVSSLCDRYQIDLVVVRREKGDLIARIEERRETLLAQGRDVPFFPSAAARYCTAEMKTAPIYKYLRRHSLVINAIGLRAEESRERRKKLAVKLNEKLSCAFCVLASENDLSNAIPYNQETFDLLVAMERESGWSFQEKRSLRSLAPGSSS
jgi:3'-phosphoadenosine 5'-phosphosulfate sulfotransferase (PAPS reductase)/FAD synthetase